MTIKKINGNLLSQRGILVHGCNSHGVMGAGIAEAFRRKWTDVFDAYRRVYETRGLEPGQAVVVASAHDQSEPWARRVADQVERWSPQLPSGVIVVNMITQKDFGRDKNTVYVSYDAISKGFSTSVAVLTRESKLPVYFPLIGCGLANGEWPKVSVRIEAAMPEDADQTLVVFNG